MPRTIDSIANKEPYRVGYSFKNPDMVTTGAKTRDPFFKMNYRGQGGPRAAKSNLIGGSQLKRFPTVWRRAAKTMNIEKLDGVMSRKELPGFDELGLGEVPGATDVTTTTSTTERDFFGFLNNTIKTVGDAIGQRQKMEIQRSQVQSSMNTMLPTFFTSGPASGIGMMGWAAILGAVGVGAYLVMKR